MKCKTQDTYCIIKLSSLQQTNANVDQSITAWNEAHNMYSSYNQVPDEFRNHNAWYRLT